MIVVYIAGPFRAKSAWEIEQNIRNAETMALAVWRAGGVALCPHTNTRFYQNAAPDEVWLRGDLELMVRCDVVLLTPNWNSSSGARAEREQAERWKMPIFVGRVSDDPDDLPAELRELLALYKKRAARDRGK